MAMVRKRRSGQGRACGVTYLDEGRWAVLAEGETESVQEAMGGGEFNPGKIEQRWLAGRRKYIILWWWSRRVVVVVVVLFARDFLFLR